MAKKLDIQLKMNGCEDVPLDHYPDLGAEVRRLGDTHWQALTAINEQGYFGPLRDAGVVDEAGYLKSIDGFSVAGLVQGFNAFVKGVNDKGKKAYRGLMDLDGAEALFSDIREIIRKAASLTAAGVQKPLERHEPVAAHQPEAKASEESPEQRDARLKAELDAMRSQVEEREYLDDETVLGTLVWMPSSERAGELVFLTPVGVLTRCGKDDELEQMYDARMLVPLGRIAKMLSDSGVEKPDNCVVLDSSQRALLTAKNEITGWRIHLSLSETAILKAFEKHLAEKKSA